MEILDENVVVLEGQKSDMEIREVAEYFFKQPEKGVQDQFSRSSGYTGFFGFTGSGMSTYEGKAQPPLHFANLASKSTGKKMELAICADTIDGSFSHSYLGVRGDYIPGVRMMGRMFDGRWKGQGGCTELTGVIHLQVPGDDKIKFIFVGYTAKAQLIKPFFVRRTFEEYLEEMSRASKKKK